MTITIAGRVRRLRGHRIVFALTHGRWPTHSIDHKDRTPINNRPGNLREATATQNMQNSGLWSSNKSGFKGVHWRRAERKWEARIEADHRVIFLGLFDDILDAVIARLGAERIYHPFAPCPRYRPIDIADVRTAP